jgi:hypothetical protein
MGVPSAWTKLSVTLPQTLNAVEVSTSASPSDADEFLENRMVRKRPQAEVHRLGGGRAALMARVIMSAS